MIYDIFYISLLKQNTTKKKRVNNILSDPKQEFKTGNNKEYKVVQSIINSIIYIKKIKS